MDTGSRPIMTYGEPAFTGGSRAPKEFPSARQIVRAVLSVHDRSEPPSGPILGEPAQTGSPRPRSLPRRAHHLASTYKIFLKFLPVFYRNLNCQIGDNHRV